MKLHYNDVQPEVRERAVTLYRDEQLSLMGVTNALGLTRSIARRILLDAGVMRPSRMKSRDTLSQIPSSVSMTDASYVAGVYDAMGGIYLIPGDTVRYQLLIRGNENVINRIKSILIVGNISNGKYNTKVYRITKQVDVEAVCGLLSLYSLNERHMTHTYERIQNARSSQEKA